MSEGSGAMTLRAQAKQTERWLPEHASHAIIGTGPEVEFDGMDAGMGMGIGSGVRNTPRGDAEGGRSRTNTSASVGVGDEKSQMLPPMEKNLDTFVRLKEGRYAYQPRAGAGVAEAGVGRNAHPGALRQDRWTQTLESRPSTSLSSTLHH